MRILYLYTKFYDKDGNERKYRGYEEVSLNFSRDYHYRAKISEQGSIKLTREKLDVPVPEGFWGDRVYNATALVGDNGSGKSSLLYSMLVVCLNRSHNMKFILLLERDDRENPLLLYTNMSVETDFQVYSTAEYPIDLIKTKFMFLDNSLSMNSVEFFEIFGRSYENYSREQLFNASLAASMVYSDWISEKGRTQRDYPVAEQIKTHFRYESYQEVRCVFNQHFRDILRRVKDKGNPVPIPERLILGIYNPADTLRERYNHYIESLRVQGKNVKKHLYTFDKHPSKEGGDILIQLSANCLVNCAFYVGGSQKPITEIMKQLDDMFSSDRFLTPTKGHYLKCIDELYPINANWYSYTDWLDINSDFRTACEDFISFIWDNEAFIRKNFHHLGDSFYSIEVGSRETDDFMTDFVDKYRRISSEFYFLTFDWRMSSGESNLLRTYTKFRYLLDGPSFPNDPRRPAAEDKIPKLGNEYGRACDSLVVILDEADLTYHPEWQRQFMMALTDFLPELFTDPYSADTSDGCKDIQIILATHSPLMLGDFPSSCVTYLREKEVDEIPREKEENGILRKNKKVRIRYIDDSRHTPTFGENIYELLRNSFYLQKGEIGALAQRKIKAVTKFLSDTEKKLSKKTLKEGEAEKLLKEIAAHRVNCVNLLADGMVRGKLERELNRLEAKLQSGLSIDAEQQSGLSIDAQIRLHEEILKELRRRKPDK